MQLNSPKAVKRGLVDLSNLVGEENLNSFVHFISESVKIVLALSLFIYVWRVKFAKNVVENDYFQINKENAARTKMGQLMDSHRIGYDAPISINNKNDNGHKIFCLCSTTAPRHTERAIHVRETWGRKCDKLVFASDIKDPYLPSEAFHNETGRPYVTFKMFAAWQWVHDHYLNQYDWFVKGDDDTFLIVENMRHYLSNFDPQKPYYFGRPLSTNRSKYHMHYVSGSAQIFSRETIRQLVGKAYPQKDLCPGPKYKANEDAFIGYCLYNIGIQSYDARDQFKRNRFMVFSTWNHLHVGAASAKNWIWRYDKTYTEGEGCCSDEAVSLHYMAGGKMLAMQYLIYQMRPFGASNSIVVRMVHEKIRS